MSKFLQDTANDKGIAISIPQVFSENSRAKKVQINSILFMKNQR